MAKKNGFQLSPSEAGILQEMFKDDIEAQRQRLRERARDEFDEAMKLHDDFEDVLVSVFLRGVQSGMSTKPKRKRKAKQAEQQAPP